MIPDSGLLFWATLHTTTETTRDNVHSR